MLRSAEYVARTGSDKCINILAGEPKGMGASWKTKALSGNSITIVVKKMWLQDVKWIDFVQNEARCWNTTMNILFHKNQHIF